MVWIISYTSYLGIMMNLKFNGYHKKAWDSNLRIHDTIIYSYTPHNIIYFNQYVECGYRTTQFKVISQ